MIMEILLSFFYILKILVIVAAIAFLIPPLVRGAPFLPSHKSAVERIIELAPPVAGQKAADIGSGEGRIVIALARAGAQAHGYEINPFLVLYSRWRIRMAGLRGKAFIHWASLWNVNYQEYDIVTVFGYTSMMLKLEKKLQEELKPGARVVSCIFPFPNWKQLDNRGRVFLYTKES